MSFKNNTVVVTGGSGGIGSIVADYFCRAGAKVVVFGRRHRIKDSRIDFRKVDVSNFGRAAQVVGNIRKKYGRIDVLVNCAGVQPPIGPFIGNDWGAWQKNLNINLLGTAWMCRLVLPAMLKRKKGSIINFSGGGSTSSRPNFSAYAVSKIGIVRFTEILADELKNTGVRVNAISPGAVNTAMLKEILAAGKKAGIKELSSAKERFKSGGTPPEKAAKLVLFLASEKSEPLSGRLISAVWDDWQKWSKKEIRVIMKGEKYTLRRVK